MTIFAAASYEIRSSVITPSCRLGFGNDLLAYSINSTIQISIGFCYRTIGTCCCIKFFGEEQARIKWDRDQFGRS